MLKKYSTILIDGYNVIFNWNYFKNNKTLDIKRETFITMMENFSSLSGKRIIIVFDGQKKNVKQSKTGNIKIIFSKKGISADTVIENYLTQRREKTIVITSDRDMSSVCILRGSRVIRSELFESYILDFIGEFYEKNKNISHNSFKDKVKNNALISLLKELKEERERYEQEKLLKEMRRLRKERQLRIENEKKELEELRNGKSPQKIKEENEEALRLFYEMYGDKKKKSKKNKYEEESGLTIEDEDFDWVSAIEESFDDFDPKSK